MTNLEHGPDRSSEGLGGAATFEKELAGLKFDEKVVADEMFDLLSRANYNGYTLVRGEILGKLHPGSEAMTREQFDAYVAKQGGRKFLEKIFLRGKAALSAQFSRAKKDFEWVKDVISQYEEGKMNGLSDEELIMTRKEVNMAKSGFADKVRKAGEMAGLKGAGISKLTFEQAFASGVVYSDAFSASFAGAAEYGSTWWEYVNRRERTATLKRAELSKKPARVLEGGTGDGSRASDTGRFIPVPDDALFPRHEMPVVSTGEKLDEVVLPSAGVSPTASERAETDPPKSLEECKRELKEIQDELVRIILPLSEKNPFIYLAAVLSPSGKDLSVTATPFEEGKDFPIFNVSISKTTKLRDFAFLVKGEWFYDPKEVMARASKEISRYVASVEKRQLEQERELAEKESKEWEQEVVPYLEGLEAELKSSPLEVEGKPLYFQQLSKYEYRVIIGGHESYTLKLDPAKKSVTVTGEVRIHPKETGTQIYPDQLIVKREIVKEDKAQIKTLLVSIPEYREDVEVDLYAKYYDKEIEEEIRKRHAAKE
jgi:hypothetical protein